uniref:Uncharacterized protein n=1 Tax=viral metagenome TaxID=1070528 RepID=A0A6C0DGN0_9ZZZZ
MIRILEFQVIGQRQQIPALMEKSPEIGSVRPADIFQDLFIHFNGSML